MIAGRAAEEIVTGTLSSSAVDDIGNATRVARRMVCEWGMSKKLGPLALGSAEEPWEARSFSEKTAVDIDEEVFRLVAENGERARSLLAENRTLLDRIAETLLEKETLDAEDIRQLVGRHPRPLPGVRLGKERENAGGT